MSCRAFRVGFGPDSGPKLTKVLGLIRARNVLFVFKLHLHGRLLAARIDILPFFFLKSRRSLTRRKIHVRFCLRDIARHARKKIKSQQSFTRVRFYRDAHIRLQLAEVTR